jgi:hypothetical protein
VIAEMQKTKGTLYDWYKQAPTSIKYKSNHLLYIKHQKLMTLNVLKS